MAQVRRHASARSQHERKVGANVARLLRGAWRENAATPAPDLSPTELTEITPLLCRSGVGALAWCKIRNTPLADTDAGRELHEVYRRFRLSALLHQREIAQVLGLFRAEGIEAVLVKGWAIARRYPDPALRPYGDIDLCVRPDTHARAEQVLERIASIEGPFVDLHRGFTRIGQTKTVQGPKSKVQSLLSADRRWTLDLGPWTKDGDDWDELYARSREVQSPMSKVQSQLNTGSAGGRGPQTGSPAGVLDSPADVGPWTLDIGLPVPVRVLSDEDHLRILCLHLLRSGARRPAWLCDVALLVEQITSPKEQVQSPKSKVQSPAVSPKSNVQSPKSSLNPQTLDIGPWTLDSVFDWDVCLGRNPVHAEWVGVAVRLAHELLGVDISATPFAQKQLPRWLVPAVLAQWGGTSGQWAVGSGQRLVQSPKSARPRQTLDFGHWTLDLRKTLDFGHWTDLYRRWDNPVRATAAVGGRFDERSRWPYRLAELLARTPEVPEHLRTLWRQVGGQRTEDRDQRSEARNHIRAWSG